MIFSPTSSILSCEGEFLWEVLEPLAWRAIYPQMKVETLDSLSEFIWFYKKSLLNKKAGLWKEVLPADGYGYVAFIAYKIGLDRDEYGVLCRIPARKALGPMHRDKKYHGYRNAHDYARGIAGR
jgi:hypothetical protein